MTTESVTLTESELAKAEGEDTFENATLQADQHHSHQIHSSNLDPSFPIPDIPSPAPTRRNRTLSASERAAAAPTNHGKIKTFCREKGHGFIVPNNGGEDVFVHVSDVDGETVPKPGDEVIYRTILIPPKMEHIQAVHVQIIAMTRGVKHDHWEDTSIKE